MRAAGEKALLAAQRGINFQLLFALSWALAGFAGALAGILYANNVRLDPSLGVLGLKAFAVALVGGLDSLGGVIPGALLVAAVEVLVGALRRPAACRRLAVPVSARDAPRAALGALRHEGRAGARVRVLREGQGVLESSFDLREQVGRQMPQSLHQTSLVDRPNLY